jgi:hypothetical protein
VIKVAVTIGLLPQVVVLVPTLGQAAQFSPSTIAQAFVVIHSLIGRRPAA